MHHWAGKMAYLKRGFQADGKMDYFMRCFQMDGKMDYLKNCFQSDGKEDKDGLLYEVFPDGWKDG